MRHDVEHLFWQRTEFNISFEYGHHAHGTTPEALRHCLNKPFANRLIGDSVQKLTFEPEGMEFKLTTIGARSSGVFSYCHIRPPSLNISGVFLLAAFSTS